MVEAGAVPLLVLCVQEPELAVRRISASALSDIAKHTPEVSAFRTFSVTKKCPVCFQQLMFMPSLI